MDPAKRRGGGITLKPTSAFQKTKEKAKCRMQNITALNSLLLKVKSHLVGVKIPTRSFIFHPLKVQHQWQNAILEGEFLIFLPIWKQVCQKNCQLQAWAETCLADEMAKGNFEV